MNNNDSTVVIKGHGRVLVRTMGPEAFLRLVDWITEMDPEGRQEGVLSFKAQAEEFRRAAMQTADPGQRECLLAQAISFKEGAALFEAIA